MLPYAFKEVANQSMRYMPAFCFASSEPAIFALKRKKKLTMAPADFCRRLHRHLSKAMCRQSVKCIEAANNDIAFILQS
jgi:hypothetical protein